MMELTREQAITEHRKMWNWIADVIEKEKESLSIYELKRKYCNISGFRNVLFKCFLCDYAEKSAKYYENKCNYCPLEWESKFDEFMCKHNIDEYKEDGLWLKCYNAETWEEKATLARRIANLPERKDV